MKNFMTLLAAMSATLLLQAEDSKPPNCNCQPCVCTGEQNCGCWKVNQQLENLQCCSCKKPCNCK